MITLDALGRWIGSAPDSENRVTLAWPAIFLLFFDSCWGLCHGR